MMHPESRSVLLTEFYQGNRERVMEDLEEFLVLAMTQCSKKKKKDFKL